MLGKALHSTLSSQAHLITPFYSFDALHGAVGADLVASGSRTLDVTTFCLPYARLGAYLTGSTVHVTHSEEALLGARIST